MSAKFQAVQQTAKNIGIDPNALLALMEIESRGNPKAVRFEPNKFFEYRPDLRGKIPFTPSPGKGWSEVPSETNYAAFKRAYQLDPAAAVKSSSWGNFQVMGWIVFDQFRSPQEFVRLFDTDPTFSFKTVEAWFKQAGPVVVKAFNDKDWHKAARFYNGPAYAKHGYHTKLRDAYNRLSKTPQVVRQATGVAKKVPTWIYVAAPLSLITLAIIIRAARK